LRVVTHGRERPLEVRATVATGSRGTGLAVGGDDPLIEHLSVDGRSLEGCVTSHDVALFTYSPK
jgi:hypothetical protein